MTARGGFWNVKILSYCSEPCILDWQCKTSFMLCPCCVWKGLVFEFSQKLLTLKPQKLLIRNYKIPSTDTVQSVLDLLTRYKLKWRVSVKKALRNATVLQFHFQLLKDLKSCIGHSSSHSTQSLLMKQL